MASIMTVFGLNIRLRTETLLISIFSLDILVNNLVTSTSE